MLYTNWRFSKLCSLKFSFLLFEMIYDIGKLRKQIKFFTKFAKNDKFNSDFPLGKMLGKYLTKKASQPLRNLDIFQKKGIKKWYQIQRCSFLLLISIFNHKSVADNAIEFVSKKKKAYSKNVHKSCICFLNKKLWAF